MDASEYADVIGEIEANDGTPYRVILEQDTDPVNPREEYEQGSTMHIVTQRYYNVPQESDLSTPWMDQVIGEHSFRVAARYLRFALGATVVLPLYHAGGNGGFSISVGAADESPEAGDYVGVVFDTPAGRKFTGWTTEGRDVIGAGLAAEAREYAAWAEGETYVHRVQIGFSGEDGDVTGWDDVANPEGIVGGYIGHEWAAEAAAEALENVVADANDTIAEGIAEDVELQAAEMGTPAEALA